MQMRQTAHCVLVHVSIALVTILPVYILLTTWIISIYVPTVTSSGSFDLFRFTMDRDIYLSNLSNYLSTCLSLGLSIRLSMFVCMFVCMYVCMYVCRFVCCLYRMYVRTHMRVYPLLIAYDISCRNFIIT